MIFAPRMDTTPSCQFTAAKAGHRAGRVFPVVGVRTSYFIKKWCMTKAI